MPYADKEKQREAQKKYEAKRKAENRERHKVWTGIFYPDSAPSEDEWREEMSQMHIKIWVSPPHDRDVWKESDEKKDSKHKAGTKKKSHRHYVVQYETQVDLQTFLSDFAFLNGGNNVKYVRSVVAMVRYLIHKDDPDKAQYDRADMLTFGGAEPGMLDMLGDCEQDLEIDAMMDYIDEHCILSFAEFVRYARANNPTWRHLLYHTCARIIRDYITCLRYDVMDGRR